LLTFEKILVIGSTGFVGKYVVQELQNYFPGAHVFGASRSCAPSGSAHLPDSHHLIDLRRPDSVLRCIADLRPDAIIFLASDRFGSLEDMLAAHVSGLNHVFAGIAGGSQSTPVIVVGSAAELGRSRVEDVPLAEDAPTNPVNPYGVTKLAQSALARMWARCGQHAVCVRLFNPIGPDTPPSLLPGRCARLLATAHLPGQDATLRFGNLDTRRDYVDVRDAARAICLSLERGRSGCLYHVGSARNHSGHEVVQGLIKVSGKAAHYETSCSEDQPIPFQTADTSLAQNELLWSPRITFEQSLTDLWDSARNPQDGR